jgi:hypothetical protein
MNQSNRSRETVILINVKSLSFFLGADASFEIVSFIKIFFARIYIL